MSLSRRTFLASTALFGWAGFGRGDVTEWLLQRKYRRVDQLQQKYGGHVEVEGCGFLDCPSYALDEYFRPPQIGYFPQPGDLLFSITDSWVWSAGVVMTGGKEPSHVGYIFRRPDGCLATMEAGPIGVPLIAAGDVVGHLAAYHGRAAVWIRPRCLPLTPEQDCRLTEFSLRQEGKPFATGRMFRQLTPVKVRGPVRSEFLGSANGPDRGSYFCSELAVEAAINAGIVPADCTRPPATYACDLFHEHSTVPYLNRNFKLDQYGWGVPSRWRPQVI